MMTVGGEYDNWTEILEVGKKSERNDCRWSEGRQTRMDSLKPEKQALVWSIFRRKIIQQTGQLTPCLFNLTGDLCAL